MMAEEMRACVQEELLLKLCISMAHQYLTGVCLDVVMAASWISLRIFRAKVIAYTGSQSNT